MQLEVHTLRFGNDPIIAECSATLDQWCERHNYPLTVWDNSHDYPTPKLVQMDMLEKFLKGKNDVMLYVDADVFVRSDAPEFPMRKAFCVATDRWHTMHNRFWREWSDKNYGEIAGVKDWNYFNAGVWSCDRANAKKLVATMRSTEFVEKYQEQHWFNTCAVKSKVKAEVLSSHWNRYCRDFEPSWFIHLWGNHKHFNLDLVKRLGLLELPPSDSLRYSVAPRKMPKSDKIIELEFIKNCGLGNQMFEWAAAYSLSRTLNLPLRWTWKASNLRDFNLGAFGLAESPARDEPFLMSKVGQGHRGLFDIAKSRIIGGKEEVCRITCPFQAEACFGDHADEIASIFELEPAELPNPDGTTPIGVQVRRGDYLKHSRLNVTTPDYFVNGMKWISERVADCHFIVVSDDPDWCSEFFAHYPNVTVMPPQEPIEGIRTLASCHHHIISNSTFGWWGAWLGERKHHGYVVTPEIWHTGGNSYGQWEPVPKRWHKVSIHPAIKLEVSTPNLNGDTPDLERAIVYPWKADAEKWHELRYSLRAIDTFFEDKECPIYIMGTQKPGWLIEGGRVRYIGAYTYQEALAKGVQTAKKVLWMNDDILLLRPTTWEDCEKTLYLKDIPEDFHRRADPQANAWRVGIVRVLAMLSEMGIKNQKVFSTHTPYVYEREKAMDVIRKFGVWEKFPMEMAYFHLHAVDPVKITTEKAWGVPFGEAQFLNFADKILTEGLKRGITELLPNRPQWEMNVGFGI